ncbi:hypothetical protein BX600DRAFT_74086 [Xylariales sp. PMI_506]|nr:hypothetical protein BX600DRAFT_74086 [Xylariales sp. PMI_506]
MVSWSIVAVALVAPAALATTNSTFSIDTNSVSLSTRASWCQSSVNICETLCGSTPSTNTCNPSTLAYACTCSDGESPDLTPYTGTLPYFICQEAYAECVANNANDATAQAQCKPDIQAQCATEEATGPVVDDVSSTVASASATTTASSSAGTASAGTATVTTGGTQTLSTATGTASATHSTGAGIHSSNVNVQTGLGACIGAFLLLMFN